MVSVVFLSLSVGIKTEWTECAYGTLLYYFLTDTVSSVFQSRENVGHKTNERSDVSPVQPVCFYPLLSPVDS